MKQIRYVAKTVGLAGAVSMLSLLSAWTAIYFAIANQPKLTVLFSVLAFQFDILDGQIARRLGKDSQFGRVLDSLVDLVNYSVLAGLATQRFLLPNAFGFAIAFLIVAFGVIRLALFTVDGYVHAEDKLYYSGVVTPHITLAISLIFLVKHFAPIPELLIGGILALLAVGQISTIKTRKTGVLIFWIPVSLLILAGSLIWL